MCVPTLFYRVCAEVKVLFHACCVFLIRFTRLVFTFFSGFPVLIGVLKEERDDVEMV